MLRTIILNCLRRRLLEKTIWADALSINQSDILEQTHQIGLMGDIYKTASTILVWLGLPHKRYKEENGRTVPAFDLLTQPSPHFELQRHDREF